jgi:signal transduction histidine kinase
MRIFQRQLAWLKVAQKVVDVTYPLLLVIGFFATLSWLLYSGNERTTIAYNVEKQLINLSLNIFGEDVETSDDLWLVATDASDIQNFGESPATSTVEPDIRAIAAFVQSLAKKSLISPGPEVVLLNFNPRLHPHDSQYYGPLADALKNQQDDAQLSQKWQNAFVIATESTQPSVLPHLLNGQIFVDPSPCEKSKGPKVVCFIKSLAINLGSDERRIDESSNHQALDSEGGSVKPLPTLLQKLSGLAQREFIIDLAPISNSSTLSITEFIKTPKPLPKILILGNQLIPESMAQTEFWGGFLYLLIKDSLIAMPPFLLSAALSIVFAMLLILITIRVSVASGLLTYVGFAVAMPMVNGILLRQANLYVPLFESLFFGLSLFLFAGFGRLSFAAYDRLAIIEKRRLHAYSADLKGNFISLLSHNLNTPIAQMQGLVDVLNLSAQDLDESKILHLRFYVAQLEIFVKGVLNAVAIEELNLSTLPVSLAKLPRAVEDAVGSQIKRLGIEHRLIFGDPESALSPISIDIRILSGTLSSIIALIAKPGEKIPITTHLMVKQSPFDKSKSRLHIDLQTDDSFISKSCQGTMLGSHEESGDEIYETVLIGMILLTIKHYHGSLGLFPKGGGGVVHLELNSN